MTLSDFASLGNIIAAIAVVISLVYLSRQVRQANLLARSNARQRMVEQTHEELYRFASDSDLRLFFRQESKLSADDQAKLHFFLVAAMRQREWEWFQYKDGVIGRDVYCAYHEVITLHLGTARTRNWWATVGRVGFNPEFVAEVDVLLSDRPMVEDYFEKIGTYDGADERTGSQSSSSS